MAPLRSFASHVVRACAAVSLASFVAGTPQASAQHTPEESLNHLKPAPEFNVALFASEPLVTNPAAIDVDTQGRVWVAEIEYYRFVPRPETGDRIKVLEDTDGDGRADKSTVFAEGLFQPMSICVAGDKVFVATSPDLWVFEDKNNDLVADGPPTKLLTGFGGHNHDHGAHSLVLGPDHKWRMSHGDGGFDVTGPDGSHIAYPKGGMLRGELDGTQLETLAVNFRNPYEICTSSFGESFVSDNDDDGNQSARICWILRGGDYGWFGRPPGPRGGIPASVPFSEHWHFRGYTPGYVPATLVTGFGSPSGMCFYEGDAFGPKYKNAALHCDPGPRVVRVYRHEPHGAGMRATSDVLLSVEGDDYFRPDDICAAPDGSLYVSDWYDGGVGGHAYNDPKRGRIYRLTPKDGDAGRLIADHQPGPYTTTADAIRELASPNLATQFLARERLLADGAASIPALTAMLADAEPNNVARALWLLDRIGGAGRDEVLARLKSDNAALRALAVRILREHTSADGQLEYAGAILELADDPSLEVVREILIALQRIRGDAADSALLAIARRYDGSDRYLLEGIHLAAGERGARHYDLLAKSTPPTAARYALYHLLDPQKASAWLDAAQDDSTIDAQTRLTMLAAANRLEGVAGGLNVVKLLNDPTADAQFVRSLLDCLAVNLEGPWRDLADRSELTAGLEQQLNNPRIQRRVLRLIRDRRLAALAPQVWPLAQDASGDVPVRVRTAAIATIAALGIEERRDDLRALLDDADEVVRGAALEALADLSDATTIHDALLGEALPESTRRRLVDRLMQHATGALILLKLIDDNRLPAPLAAAAIAQAASHPDANVRVLYERHIPAADRPQRLGEQVEPAAILALTGDATRGEQIFTYSTAAQCKNCHAVAGQGGAIGPNLSAIGKKYERAALLETILDPSRAIAPEYRVYTLETGAGLVHAGFLVEQTDREVVLKDAEGKLTRVPAEEVEHLEATDRSMMPDLVLRDITAQDAADLLAYLETLRSGD
jgi:putative membrane-bound dehydrogenase-like protein